MQVEVSSAGAGHKYQAIRRLLWFFIASVQLSSTNTYARVVADTINREQYNRKEAVIGIIGDQIMDDESMMQRRRQNEYTVDTDFVTIETTGGSSSSSSINSAIPSLISQKLKEERIHYTSSESEDHFYSAPVMAPVTLTE